MKTLMSVKWQSRAREWKSFKVDFNKEIKNATILYKFLFQILISWNFGFMIKYKSISRFFSQKVFSYKFWRFSLLIFCVPFLNEIDFGGNETHWNYIIFLSFKSINRSKWIIKGCEKQTGIIQNPIWRGADKLCEGHLIIFIDSFLRLDLMVIKLVFFWSICILDLKTI